MRALWSGAKNAYFLCPKSIQEIHFGHFFCPKSKSRIDSWAQFYALSLSSIFNIYYFRQKGRVFLSFNM